VKQYSEELRPNGSPQNAANGNSEQLPKCTPAALLDRFYASVCSSVRRFPKVTIGIRYIAIGVALMMWNG